MFYTFIQNNSGGKFKVNQNVAHYVIIEARSYHEANSLAENVGLYFDGEGDCPCCGNRWSAFYDEEGTEIPEIYSQQIEFVNNGQKQALRFESYWTSENNVILYPLGSIAA